MKNLRQLRRGAALTQYRLAELSDVPRVKISHAELGIVALAPDEVARIRKVLLEVSKKNSARVLKELTEPTELGAA